MNRPEMKKNNNQYNAGFMVPFCGLLIVVFFAIASFVIDIGNARYQLRSIQVAADASSLAGVLVLGTPTPNITNVRNKVYEIANANNVSNSEVTSVFCGTWSGGVFTPQTSGGSPICNGSSTAVQVAMSRQVNTFFGKVINFDSITPATLAAASKIPLNDCIRPFVLRDTQLSGVLTGNNFTISGSGAGNGNWGKLDYPGGNGSNYSLTADVCRSQYVLGGSALTQTGNAAVSDAFDTIAGTAAGTGFVVALTSTVISGNSLVVITEFVRLTLVSTNGLSGQNFSALLTLVERPIPPNVDPNVSQRKLIK